RSKAGLHGLRSQAPGPGRDDGTARRGQRANEPPAHEDDRRESEPSWRRHPLPARHAPSRRRTDRGTSRRHRQPHPRRRPGYGGWVVRPAEALSAKGQESATPDEGVHRRWAAPAVDESLRYWTVIQNGVARVSTHNVEIGGHLIREGDAVIVHLPTTNRD